MIRFPHLVVCVAALELFVGCERRMPPRGRQSAPTAAAAVYRVRLYRRLGTDHKDEIAEGFVYLSTPLDADRNSDGTWELSMVSSDPLPALARFKGSGKLSSSKAGDAVGMDLNPGAADYNLQLILIPQPGGAMEGLWQVTTDAGVEAQGAAELRPAPAGQR